MGEKLEMRGALSLYLIDRDGKVVYEARYGNHIVTSGRMLVAQLFASAASGVAVTGVTHMAVGTNKPANPDDPDRPVPSDGDSSLTKEVARSPIEVDGEPHKFTEKHTSENGEEINTERIRLRLKSVFDLEDDANGHELREAGLIAKQQEIDGAAKWVMYNRVVFAPISKTQDFKLTLVWDIDF